MRTPKDWGQPCPNPACTHYRRRQQGNVRAIATDLTHSGTRRVFRGHTCATHCAETRAPVFFDLRTSEDTGMMALQMLLGRVDLAGLCVVLGVTAETVVAWLQRAAPQAAAINRSLLRDWPVPPGQLDERWHFIERQPARATATAGESLPDGEDGRHWVWSSFAPACRLMSAAVVGPRTLDPAKEIGAATTARVAGLPAFLRDGFPCSLAARIAACHLGTPFAPPGKRGRPRQPLYAPQPELV